MRETEEPMFNQVEIDQMPVANVCWYPFQYGPQVSVQIAKQRLQTKVAAYMELKTTRNAHESCGFVQQGRLEAH